MVSFIFQGLAILSLAASLVAGTPTPPDTTAPRFPLRVWTHPRNPGYAWSHYAEIDPRSGEVVVNKTIGYTGFQSYITDPTVDAGSPWRKGPMYAVTKEQAFLVPVPGPDTATPPALHTYYQLKYAKKVPKDNGILWNNHTVIGRDCGGQCGGLALGYNTPNTLYSGQYYIVPSAPGSSIYKLRWKEDNVPAAYGSTLVFVWTN
ncbi:hypothetical protein DFH27DRAFT_13767 [Peziza echinospora]|nr:hypothetical protein DFH27DRAFT_13767 [Peziza echinospora]